jgi:hypothetical protein
MPNSHERSPARPAKPSLALIADKERLLDQVLRDHAVPYACRHESKQNIAMLFNPALRIQSVRQAGE